MSNATNAVTSQGASTVELTAYQGGAAVIRETRKIKLPKGRSCLFLGGLPRTFVPNSQILDGIRGHGKFHLSGRSLRPANLTTDSILAKSVGSKITLLEETGGGNIRRVTGKLLKILDGSAVLEKANGQTLVTPLTSKFELANGIPAGLSDLTILAMEPNTSEGGEYELDLLYEAGNINWTPWYEVIYNSKTGKLERFACNIDLTNASGTNFNDAGIKLIAGINRGDAAMVRPMQKHARAASLERAMAPMGGGMPQADFSVETAEVETVGDQKLYSLSETVNLETDVPNSPTLAHFTDVPVVHEYHAEAGAFRSLDGDDAADLPKLPVMVKLRLTNDKANGLGTALPPADVRIFERDSKGKLQKTDTARVSGHIADGEEFVLSLRNPAKEVKHTRQQIDYKEDQRPAEQEVEVTPEGGLPTEAVEATSTRRSSKKKAVKKTPRFAEEEREVTVYNYKSTDVEVVVHENVPQGAKLLHKSHDFLNFGDKTSNTFRVTVPAKQTVTGVDAQPGSFTLRYRIKYRLAD